MREQFDGARKLGMAIALATALALLAAGSPFACAASSLKQASMPASKPMLASSGVIPRPLHVDVRAGDFVLDRRSAIIVTSDDPEAVRIAGYLAARLGRAGRGRLPVRIAAAHPPGRAMVLRLDPQAPVQEAEGYVLDVAPRGVEIVARQPHGLFNGVISLLQLATADAGHAGRQRIRAQHIEDKPRFAWRGLMLDSARHMQSPEQIKQFLDAMALHKLNVFQWHLTDDQGWRLPIDKYPRLTEVGAWRIPAGAAGVDRRTGQAVRYGGFYTHDMVRDIVRYAAERYITVVPEIDMPGHAQAAVAAYPQFGSVDAAPPVSHDWGVHGYLFNVDEATFGFLEDVLTEVMALFPGQYIHIGGDEAVKDQWKASASVQQRMRELGVANETAMQAYLTARMQKFLAAHGRRLIGWDEILEGGLPADAAVMSWRGVDGAVAATAAGHDSVLSPWPLLYLDNRQGTGAGEPPGRVRVVSLEDIYRFDPLPPTMSAAQGRHLLGVQANVWTEHIRTADRVGWMSFPRAAALAEMGWSAPERRDWDDFLRRLPGLYASYDALGIVHADSAYAVHATTRYLHHPERAMVALSTQFGQGGIRYTLDGRPPGPGSPRYNAALTLPLPVVLKAATFSSQQRLAHTTTLSLRRETEQRRSSAELKLCSDNISLDLEDDAPATGPRAVFPVDIQNPCWLFEQADLDAADRIVAAVGSVPFNFQIGDAVKKIQFAKPATPEGELLVLLDRCDGEEIARLPLVPAAPSDAVTVLPAATLKRVHGRHDLCLRFAQPGLDPIHTLDSIQLIDSKQHAAPR